MKKLLLIAILMLALVITAVACTTTPEEPGTSDAEVTTVETPTEAPSDEPDVPTEEPDTDPVTEPEETEPQETEPQETEPEATEPEATQGGDDQTQAPVEGGDGTQAGTTEEKKGCGGFVAGGAFIVAILGTALIIKKRD